MVDAAIPSNCWLDDDGPCPSPCVFDDPSERVADCCIAVELQADGKPKTACKYYRAVLAAAQGEAGTQKLARHPDGTPMVSIGKAVPVGDWERLASDPDHSRACMVGRPAQPAPPAEGEVAELVAWLRGANWDRQRQTLASRAAELLAQAHPTPPAPVPVSERPWEREGWCDAQGRCWWGRPESDDWSTDWTLATPEHVEEFCTFMPMVVCLPASALPLPSAEVPG